MVPSSYARNVVTGNGVTTGYATSIIVKEPTDLKVDYITPAGVRSPLTYQVDYDVYINETGYATVIMNTAPETGATVVFYRDTPRTQGTNFRANSRLPAATLERQLDAIVLGVQEVEDKVARAPAVSDTWRGGPLYIDPPDAGKLLRANAAETGWEHVDLASIDPDLVTLPLPVAQGGTGATNGAAALANLGLLSVSHPWTAEQAFPSGSGVVGITDPVELTVDQKAVVGTDIAQVSLRAHNASSSLVPFARLLAKATSRSPGAESGTLALLTRRSGVLTTELLAADGLVVGAASGGAKGVGTINAAGYYLDGVALSQPTAFRSAPLTISNGASYTALAAHGLGAVPSLIQARLVAQAYPEFGYNEGDEVTFWSAASGLSLWANTEVVGITVNDGFVVRHKTNDSNHMATPASWRLILIAIKI